MNRQLLEWIAVGVLYLSLIGVALFLEAADLVLLAALTVIPLVLLLAARRNVPLVKKLRMASPIAIAMPILLCVIWGVQFPEKLAFFVLGGVCGAVYMVCFDAIVKLVWTRRDVG